MSILAVLTLRDKPNPNANVLITLHFNDPVEMLGVGTSGWAQVRDLRSSVVGWAAPRYLSSAPLNSSQIVASPPGSGPQGGSQGGEGSPRGNSQATQSHVSCFVTARKGAPQPGGRLGAGLRAAGGTPAPPYLSTFSISCCLSPLRSVRENSAVPGKRRLKIIHPAQLHSGLLESGSPANARRPGGPR